MVPDPMPTLFMTMANKASLATSGFVRGADETNLPPRAFSMMLGTAVVTAR
jgi:hypothetical protein